MKESLIRDRSYIFALTVLKVCKQLSQDRDYVISRQLLKSGTSIGANIEEALAGQSRADFLSKMAIASKEAREANYWLRLLRDSGTYKSDGINELVAESEALVRILTSIVKTTSARSASTTQNSKLKTKNPI